MRHVIQSFLKQPLVLVAAGVPEITPPAAAAAAVAPGAVAAAVPVDQSTAVQLMQQLPMQPEDPAVIQAREQLAQELAVKAPLQEHLSFTYLDVGAANGEDIVYYSGLFAPPEHQLRVRGKGIAGACKARIQI